MPRRLKSQRHRQNPPPRVEDVSAISIAATQPRRLETAATQPRRLKSPRHRQNPPPRVEDVSAVGNRGDTAPAIEIAATQPRRLKSRRHSPGESNSRRYRQNPPPRVEDKFHTVLIAMRDNFTQLYIHFVWATWDRLPLITPDIQLEQQDSPTIPLRLVAGGMRVRE